MKKIIAKKIIALGGSNSKKSINKQLAVYTANQIKSLEIIVIDLNDFKLPLYGIDLETSEGIPENAQNLYNLFSSVDGFIISLAEHNGGYSTAFKNALDWVSRIDKKNVERKTDVINGCLSRTQRWSRGAENSLRSFSSFGWKYRSRFFLAFFSQQFF